MDKNETLERLEKNLHSKIVILIEDLKKTNK